MYPELDWYLDEAYTITLSVLIKDFPQTDEPLFNIEKFKQNYKKFYFERIKMITDKYDKIKLSNKNQLIYDEAKDLAEQLKSVNTIDFESYNNIRAIFNAIRNQHGAVLTGI